VVRWTTIKLGERLEQVVGVEDAELEEGGAAAGRSKTIGRSRPMLTMELPKVVDKSMANSSELDAGGGGAGRGAGAWDLEIPAIRIPIAPQQRARFGLGPENLAAPGLGGGSWGSRGRTGGMNGRDFSRRR